MVADEMNLLRDPYAVPFIRIIAAIVVMVGAAGAAVTTPAQEDPSDSATISSVDSPAPALPAAAIRPAAASHSGLKRCLGSDGGVIFTDRRCEDLQAADLTQSPSPGSRLARTRSCARNQDDFLFGVRMAI